MALWGLVWRGHRDGELAPMTGENRPFTAGWPGHRWRLPLLAVAGVVLAAVPASQASALLRDSPAAGAFQAAAKTKPAHQAGDEFGWSVAISGSTAAVGAPGVKSGRGAVYVYARSDGRWRQEAMLTDPANTDNDMFGVAVAVSGAALVVGDPSSGKLEGAVYVYARSHHRRRLTATLADPVATDDGTFGYSVAASGHWIVVGDPAAGTGTAGDAYFYARSSGSWRVRAIVADPAQRYADDFGYSVAISSSRSGTVAAIGSYPAPGVVASAYVYRLLKGTWQLSKALADPASSAGDDFGADVAISGTIMVIGSQYSGQQRGAAYVYAQSGARWKLRARLAAAHSQAGDDFGAVVAVSGTKILVADPGMGCGRGYEFLPSRGSWHKQLVVVPPNCEGGVFGISMALSGNTAIVGAPYLDKDAGAAYQITLPHSAKKAKRGRGFAE